MGVRPVVLEVGVNLNAGVMAGVSAYKEHGQSATGHFVRRDCARFDR